MRRSNLQEADDTELIAHAAKADREAFGALYERYVFWSSSFWSRFLFLRGWGAPLPRRSLGRILNRRHREGRGRAF